MLPEVWEVVERDEADPRSEGNPNRELVGGFMDTRIVPERLEALKSIVLERGRHEDQPPYCAN